MPRGLLRSYVLPAIGARPLQALRVGEIDRLYADLEKRLSISTVRHVHVALKAMLAVAVRKGLLQRNPVADADVPRPIEPAVGQALDASELRRLIDGFRGASMFPIVVTAALTGARLSEVLALQWRDLDPAARTLRIERAVETTSEFGRRLKEPKTRRGKRTIAIDDTLLGVLLAEREKHVRIAAGVADGMHVDLSLIRLPADGLIFPSPLSPFDFTRLRNPKSVTKETRARFRKLGFDRLRFHDLRGSHGTALLDAGVPVHVVAARLGHDASVLLKAYAKRTKQSDEAAAEAIGAIAKGVL